MSGKATLEGLAQAPRIAKWTLEQFEGALGDEVLEAGCGIGSFTEHLVDRRRLHALDIEGSYVGLVSAKLHAFSCVTVQQADLQEQETYDRLRDFDSVLSINVLEHLDLPEKALAGFSDALKPGGTALILVPAHPWLFSAADAALEHRRRYTEDELRSQLEDAGFVIESIRQFNRLGVFGWFVNKIFRKTTLSPWQTRLFSLMLPVARIVERIRFLPGLSLTAVGRKPI